MITRFIYSLHLRERITWKIKRFYPNVSDKNVTVVFDKKLKFDLLKTDVGHQSIIFNGFYELELTNKILKIAKLWEGVMVDVGANYGYFSCLWASQNPQNKVYAFEASPMNVNPLKNNVDKIIYQNQSQWCPLLLVKKKEN
ncbi:hypothetical protein EZS27_000736 [termite gut metagenome]|uniref:Methyltransferase FkbM domain-containing protein n=1 Tax=termite gut metagenome TaxID=433724 RepID=A0A5J4T0G5_9ZZZZ